MTEFRSNKPCESPDLHWVLSGHLLYSACQWGIVVALAKLGTRSKLANTLLGFGRVRSNCSVCEPALRALLVSELIDPIHFRPISAFRLFRLGAALLLVTGAVACLRTNWRLNDVSWLDSLRRGIRQQTATDSCRIMDEWTRLQDLSSEPSPLAGGSVRSMYVRVASSGP